MASGTNGIFNSDYMPYTIAASLEMSDEPIIFGLLVWLAVPLLFKGQLKKNRYKALAMACKIIGIAIILWTLLNQVLPTA